MSAPRFTAPRPEPVAYKRPLGRLTCPFSSLIGLALILHVLLYALLCLTPALILIPLRIIDRDPANEIGDEQDPDGPSPDRDEDGAAMRIRAA